MPLKKVIRLELFLTGRSRPWMEELPVKDTGANQSRQKMAERGKQPQPTDGRDGVGRSVGRLQ